MWQFQSIHPESEIELLHSEASRTYLLSMNDKHTLFLGRPLSCLNQYHNTADMDRVDQTAQVRLKTIKLLHLSSCLQLMPNEIQLVPA